MGDRGEIFQTPRSEIFQFRSWIPDERRYYTKTLKTKDRRTALQRAEEEALRINSSKKLGHSVFGATIKQLCPDWIGGIREKSWMGSYQTQSHPNNKNSSQQMDLPLSVGTV